jgi:hypothetical protein
MTHFVRKASAPYRVEDRAGVTVAIAMLVTIPGPMPTDIDIERWVKRIDKAILRTVEADATSAVGVTIRVTERAGKRIADSLILDAAVDCPTRFRRAQEERPTRTVAHVRKPQGDVTN